MLCWPMSWPSRPRRPWRCSFVRSFVCVRRPVCGRAGHRFVSGDLGTTGASQRAYSQPGLLPACGSWHGHAPSPKDACKKLAHVGCAKIMACGADIAHERRSFERRRGSPLSTFSCAQARDGASLSDAQQLSLAL